MNFLSPWLIPLAVVATVPPLLLLYFLKLKRREIPIASTLLWRKAVEDLQVNSPFQRLRNSLLLILQLLALAAAALAIGEPMLAGQRGVEKAIVLMIDHSGSMATQEDGKTRLEIAKREAARVVDDMTAAQRAMVISFADRAQVLVPFTDDKNALRRAIDSIRQTDEPGKLTEAMALAQAHSTPVGEVGRLVDIGESQYMLFTDGRLADAAQTVVQRGTLEIVRIGKSTENVGILNLDVRRHYETPEQVSVLARIRNFGTQPATRDVSLLVDGDLKAVQTVTLAPLGKPEVVARQSLGGPAPDGVESNVAFELTLDTAARIEVSLSSKEGQDAFAADDRAFALTTAPRPVSVLLVTPGDRFLQRAVESLQLGNFETWTPQEYESKPKTDLEHDGRCKYDVVVFDGHSTERLPMGNYIFFAGTPITDGVSVSGNVQGQMFLDWDDTHPILRHVAVASMIVFSWENLKMPAQATTLIDAANGPVMSLLSRDRRQYLVCAFGLFDQSREHLNTTWMFQEGMMVFLQNAIRYLAGATTAGQVPSVTPGEAFEVAVQPGRKEAKIRRPDGSTDSAPVQPNNMIAYGRTDQIGVYTIASGLPGDDARAVNLLDETESWIGPNEQFQIAAGKVEARTGKDLVKRPLWPWILGAMGVILAVEWIVYNKRMFV
jgi:hypothetical protein